MSQESKPLLPCPFCGQEGWVVGDSIWCPNYKCAAHKCWATLDEWNTRAEPRPASSAQGMREAVRAYIEATRYEGQTPPAQVHLLWLRMEAALSSAPEQGELEGLRFAIERHEKMVRTYDGDSISGYDLTLWEAAQDADQYPVVGKLKPSPDWRCKACEEAGHRHCAHPDTCDGMQPPKLTPAQIAEEVGKLGNGSPEPN